MNLARKNGASLDDLYEGLASSTSTFSSSDSDAKSKMAPHEVLTYTLTKLSEAAKTKSGSNLLEANASSVRSSNRSSAPSFYERKSVTSDEWVDIESESDYYETDFPGKRNVYETFTRGTASRSSKTDVAGATAFTR